MDHLYVDLESKRLFVAALSNKTVEVVDLKAGKRIFSIPGLSKPHSVFYSPEFKRLFVADGCAESDVNCHGSLKIFKIFDGDTFKLLKTLPMGDDGDADATGYDPSTKYLYVGYGDRNSGALGIVDTRTDKHIGDIKTPALPGAIILVESTPQIFARMMGTPNLGVIDREKRELIATWTVTGAVNSFALAWDEADHRLFDTSRSPPMLMVFDTESGKQITDLDSVAGIDGMWYDATRKRIYATGGCGLSLEARTDGLIAVYQQKGPNTYELMANVPSQFGACTGIWVPQLNRLYVSAPGVGEHPGAILVFAPIP
jgi:DNA-binding beta-propeller fold protein YncE